MEEKQVLFSLIPQSGFTPNEQEQSELDDLSRKRDGICYGKTEVFENGLRVLKFVVEDEETGEVYEINPKLVKFKK
jgi:hypothetical protein